ncbi:MAG: CCA tRNA nucleotidyltransferase [Nanoarchaeota archaeon]|nr:CCA tRNA nucleotidyltransferase [Nanoarchaeota archaeon]
MAKISLSQQVLARIKPTPAQKTQDHNITALFLKTLNSKLKDATAILGGSGAKDTWLAGNHDVDVFVLFDYTKYSASSIDLSNLLETALQKAFPALTLSRVHGSRDYFQLMYNSLNMEVVPILKIANAEQAKNITDVSPLHSIWVNKHTTKLKDDIRLTKQFLKANNLYGAESHIMGLSGYVVEILIAHYGSFEKLLKASQLWKLKEVVDAGKHYPKKDALFHLNQSKTQSPLIVIDPVDKSRNAAAALSLEKLQLFQKVAKAYLTHPDISFFEKKKIDFNILKKEVESKKKNLLFMSIIPLPGKEDVVGTKLVKVFEFLRGKLADFSIIRSGWEWEHGKEALFYFIFAKKELPPVEIRSGPPLNLKEHVDHFKKEHKDTFVKEGKIYANVKVLYPKLDDFVQVSMKDKYVLEKIKKVNEIKIV